MDEVDRSILAVLERHGRISNAELAAKVGLSPSPCLRRVRRLEETGVIRGYRALIDPAAVGRSLRIFVGVRLMRHARADVVAFERAVLQLREVVYSHHVTGNYDYLLQVEVADLAAYEDFHANRLASLPGVAMVTSYVTMKTLSADTARPAGRRRLERPANLYPQDERSDHLAHRRAAPSHPACQAQTRPPTAEPRTRRA
jgi:Lrp/AsnC family transcriptional regulator, leucine-responsive regulatory protein